MMHVQIEVSSIILKVRNLIIQLLVFKTLRFARVLD